MAGMDFSVDQIKILLDYNPNTGIFIWKVRVSKAVKAGDIAGSSNGGGYHRIKIGPKRYLAHKLAWFLIYGEWVEGELDHIDRDPSNNAISNLRLATHGQNQRNKKGCLSSSGYKGVSWHKGKKRYQARISIDKKTLCLGDFDCPVEAARKYDEAAKIYHGEYANTNFG